jgi:peptidylprolyl isomerase
MTQAKPGDTVRIHYTGTLADGTEFDSNVGGEPLEFTLGSGQIIAGLDTGITGMEEGETATVSVAPEEAYGPHDPAKVQKVERDRVPDEIDLRPGMQLGARAESGQQITFTVVDIADDEITIDANHPLAGKELNFEVELVEVK